MPDIIKNSIFYNLLAAIGSWFSEQFNDSCLIGRFLREGGFKAFSDSSIFTKIFNGIVSLFRKIFSALHLDRLFEGSIFKMPFLWCFLAMVFAPVLPTMGVVALALAGFLALAIRLFTEKSFKLRYSPLNKYILIYALVYFVATLTSVTVKGSLFGAVLFIVFALFYFVVINAVQTKTQLKVLTLCFMGFAVLVSFYGFYQYMNPSKFSGSWIDTEMFSDIGFRVYATLGNPNVLGEYLLLTIPFGVSFFFTSKGILKKGFFFIVCAIQMLCLILKRLLARNYVCGDGVSYIAGQKMYTSCNCRTYTSSVCSSADDNKPFYEYRQYVGLINKLQILYLYGYSQYA